VTRENLDKGGDWYFLFRGSQEARFGPSGKPDAMADEEAVAGSESFDIDELYRPNVERDLRYLPRLLVEPCGWRGLPPQASC